MKTIQLIALALFVSPLSSAYAQEGGEQDASEEQLEPEARFTVNGYTMASFEYFNIDQDRHNNIEFGWQQGRSEGARDCARKSQVALKAALENLTRDGVDRLGLKEYGFDTIYLITADFDLVRNPIGEGKVWPWWSNPPGTERDGLIKFQGYYKNGVCKHPTEADLLAFAEAQIAKAKVEDAARAAADAVRRAAQPTQEEVGAEVEGGELSEVGVDDSGNH
jgi:hypothetical protein